MHNARRYAAKARAKARRAVAGGTFNSIIAAYEVTVQAHVTTQQRRDRTQAEEGAVAVKQEIHATATQEWLMAGVGRWQVER